MCCRHERMIRMLDVIKSYRVSMEVETTNHIGQKHADTGLKK